MHDDKILITAQSVAHDYAALPEVAAVALGGSRSTAAADHASDIDLYVYVDQPLRLEQRAAIADKRARYAEVGNDTWEPGDEWIERDGGIKIDAMFRSTAWIEEQLDRVLDHHQASVGYTTCLWYNVRTSITLVDRDGWFAQLQHRAQQPYPEPLRRAIIAKNYPILRHTLSSYRNQIKLAVARDDAVSVNHRVAALLASYFDVLFALNHLPHPGEKRLIAYATRHCALLPAAMAEQIDALLRAAAQHDHAVVEMIDALIDNLDELLRREDLLPISAKDG